MPKPLLTIAIPTYNRSACLQLCLSVLLPQVERAGGEVEVIVSDNASMDDTPAVVAAHQGKVPILYLRNEENVGADRNFIQCFGRAQGDYMLLLGDDDVLLEGALQKLIPILRNRQAGVVHIKGYGFREDYRKEHPRRPGSGRTLEYRNPRAFARKVNINLTFMSGNVVHRACVHDEVRLEDFCDTNLVQLGWLVPAILKAPVNLVYDEYLIAAKAENTGGYGLCKVFGLNMHGIFQRFMDQGLDPGFFRQITGKTITHFFPHWILKLRAKGGDFHHEDYFETLRPIFCGHASFWLMVWPAARWPLALARPWFKLCKQSLKLFGRW